MVKQDESTQSGPLRTSPPWIRLLDGWLIRVWQKFVPAGGMSRARSGLHGPGALLVS